MFKKFSTLNLKCRTPNLKLPIRIHVKVIFLSKFRICMCIIKSDAEPTTLLSEPGGQYCSLAYRLTQPVCYVSPSFCSGIYPSSPPFFSLFFSTRRKKNVIPLTYSKGIQKNKQQKSPYFFQLFFKKRNIKHDLEIV